MKVTSAKFVAAATTTSSFVKGRRPEVAFIGRSNVGKSSLMNSLLGVKGLARTSSTPGRTQTINFFLINEAIHFVDLPGYGYAKVSKQARAAWGALIDDYLAQRKELVLIILIVDARHEPSPLDLQMKSWLQHFSLNHLVVATKIDKLSSNEQSRSLQRLKTALETERVLPYSSVTGAGSKQVWEAIQAEIAAHKQRVSQVQKSN